MGISLGSSSKKPYVGSKEVKEAYVGSTLVYSAGPGSNYAFLGTADDYYLAEWCTFKNTVIQVIDGVNKLSLNSGGSQGVVTLDISGLNGYTTLKFKGSTTGSSSVLRTRFDGANPVDSTTTKTEKQFSVTIPSGTQTITMQCVSIAYDIRLNDIYLEK